MPDALGAGHRPPVAGTSNGDRWIKFPTSRSNIANDGSRVPGEGRDRQHRGLRAHARPRRSSTATRSEGYCYVVSGSTQRGRAEAAAATRCPQAIAYYTALERRADVVFHASPVPARRAARSPSTSTGPSTTTRWPTRGPGPEMTIYRLDGGRVRAGRRRPDSVAMPRHRHATTPPRPRDRARRSGAWAASAPTRSSARSSSRDGEVARRGLARRVRRRRTPRSTRSPPAATPTCTARRSTSRSSRAATRASTPPCTDAILAAGHRARRRRLRRPEREGLRPRPRHPARRGRRGRRRRRRARRPRAAASTRPSASTRAPAARGSSSSRR